MSSNLANFMGENGRSDVAAGAGGGIGLAGQWQEHFQSQGYGGNAGMEAPERDEADFLTLHEVAMGCMEGADGVQKN